MTSNVKIASADLSSQTQKTPDRPNEFVRPVDGLKTFWDYLPSDADFKTRRLRWWAHAVHRRLRPDFLPIKPIQQHDIWLVYFVFIPDGQLSVNHRFTLTRLRDLGHKLFVVCATTSPADVPEDLVLLSDAIYWKGLNGYDFSAYTIALEAIAQHSPHANVVIMNDSMFGPFVDLRPFVLSAPWGLTGFTASALMENHLQSYAFILRDVNPSSLHGLKKVFLPSTALNHANQVILCQELMLARVAREQMSVGAYWYADGSSVRDPCLHRPFQLLNAGFPFMKRSLLGKMRKFQTREEVLNQLEHAGHPLPSE